MSKYDVTKSMSLTIKCRNLLESGLTYEQVKQMLKYDKRVYENREAAIQLLKDPKDLSEKTIMELYQTSKQPSIIDSIQDYGIYKTALDNAKDTIDYEYREAEKEESYIKELKNTNLD